MFLEKIKKILFGQERGSYEERFEKPSVYAPGKGVGEKLEEPAKIVVSKEYLISLTMRNLFMIAVFLIAFLIVGGLLYRLFRFDVKKVSLDIRGVEAAASGKPFAFKVVVRNANRNDLGSTFLTITEPKEISYLKVYDGNLEKTQGGYKIILGEVAAKSIKEVNFEAMAMAPKDAKITLGFELNFVNPLSLTRNIVNNTYLVMISEDPLDFSITQGTPTIVYNQEVKFVIRYRNKTDIRIHNAKIELFYPLNFQPYRYSRLPSSGNNIWRITGLARGDEEVIEIYGVFDFVDNQKEAAIEGRIFSINERNEEVVVARGILNFPIKEPPLLISVSAYKLILAPGPEYQQVLIPKEEPFKEVNGVMRGDDILFRIKIKNTSMAAIEDIKLEAFFDLDGREIENPPSTYVFARNINDPLLYKDPKFIDIKNRYTLKITDSGLFTTSSNMVIWDKFKYPALTILAPQETKETAVIIKIKDKIEPVAGNSFMRSLVTFRVYSDKVPFQLAGLKLEDSRTFALKMNTDFGMTPFHSYESPYFESVGRIPFQVQVKTTYVIGFKVYNTFNTLSNFVLRGKLSPYFDYENTFYPQEEDVTFDPLNREIIWKVAKLLPGANYYTDGPKMYFQVSITPTKDLPFFYDNQRPEDVKIIQNKEYPAIPIFTDIRAEANDDFLSKKVSIKVSDIKIKTYIIK